MAAPTIRPPKAVRCTNCHGSGQVYVKPHAKVYGKGLRLGGLRACGYCGGSGRVV